MTRGLWLAVATLALITFSVPAFADTTGFIDPNVGFCPPPATAAACTTANGMGGETIKVGTTSFGMWSNGAQDANTPWYLILAVPEMSAGSATAPKITSPSFTQSGTTVDAGPFTQTTPNAIYDFAEKAGAIPSSLGSNTSMNAANLFCDGATIPCKSSNEISAFGKLPTDFEIFVYTFSPGFLGGTPYEFFSSPGMVGGTYLAAIGVGGKTSNIQFSTPFTDTGIAQGTPVPEPSSLLLFGGGLIGLAGLVRRRIGRT